MKQQIRNSLLATLVPLLLFSYASLCVAQVLGVPEIFQEQNCWCWAGCSRAILLYYGTDVAQCTIADWARQQNGWGNDNCCTNPGGTICNQYNQLAGINGSIQSILQHWGVNSTAWGKALSQTTVSSEIGAGRPFVIRWGWTDGKGHFIVGRGIQGNNVSYMDPWPGNGYTTATYNWVVSGSGHSWTSSLQLTTNVTSADVWITDWGTPPGSPPPYKTPDIWLSNTPQQGIPNTIFAKVHNNGPNNAPAVNVAFSVYYFASGNTNWVPAGTDVVTVASGAAVNASVPWTPQWSEHACVKVELTCGADPNTNNNLAKENYQIQKGSGGGWAESHFWIYNPFEETKLFVAQWDTVNIPSFLNLELSPQGEFQLAPADSLPGFIGYRFPENAVPGDTATVHFTQRLITGEPVGGLTVDFVVSDGLAFIEVTSPNGGETWLVGSEQPITWEASPSIGEVKLEYSTDVGTNWEIIEPSHPNDGSYPWIIPDEPSNECLLRISDVFDELLYDVSDGFFNIRYPQEAQGYEIYIVPPTGGVPIRVTNLPNIDVYNPSWSPDATMIGHDALNFNPGYLASHDIFITEVATGISSPLVGAEGGNDCSWSSWGDQITFDRNGDIWVVPASGGVASQIREYGFDPDWSSNYMIVYTFSEVLWTIPADLSASKPLTADPGRDFDPVWSPNGQWVAFTSIRSGNPDIWKIQVDELGNPLGPPIQLTFDPSWDSRPTWSPNSEEIAFQSGRSGNADIWRINAAGGVAEPVTTSPFNEFDPAWSPDGQFIAFSSNGGVYVHVVIPDTNGAPGTLVDIPINVITDVTGMGIIATEIELSWNASVLDNASAALGSMASGWSMSYNSTPGSGQMSIWMAGTEDEPPTDDLAGTGSLVILTFDVVGQNLDSTLIHFEKMVFNEGDPLAITQDGLFKVFTGWDITGNIYYCLNNEPMDDAIVPAVGTLYKDTTDVNGDYELLDLSGGDYVVKPEKEDDLGTPSAISAFDAAWILQYGVGLRTFGPCQMIAGDVSGNGGVSAFDAAKILQYGVGLINQFPVMPDSTHFWRFVPDDFALTLTNWMNAPDSIAYSPLNSDIADNYKGIIYGDVSGNWHPTEKSLAKSPVAIEDIRLENVHGESGEKISLPLYLDNGTDIIAMSFILEYNPHVLKALGASLTSLTRDYQIAYKAEQARIKVALAGSRPIAGSGVIVNLEFEVLGSELPETGSLLQITEMVINESNIGANIQAARFEMGTTVPDEYALQQNYPNPFNPETTIKYQLPKSGKVVLKIYNTLGHEVRILVNEEKEAGYHEIRWDGKDDKGAIVTSGVYIYRIQSGDFFKVRKMLFMR